MNIHMQVLVWTTFLWDKCLWKIDFEQSPGHLWFCSLFLDAQFDLGLASHYSISTAPPWGYLAKQVRQCSCLSNWHEGALFFPPWWAVMGWTDKEGKQKPWFCEKWTQGFYWRSHLGSLCPWFACGNTMRNVPSGKAQGSCRNQSQAIWGELCELG